MIIDTSSGNELASKDLSDRGVGCEIMARPDGATLLVQTAERPALTVLDTQSFEVLTTLDPMGPVMWCSYSSDGASLMTICRDGAVRLWSGVTPPRPMTVSFTRSVQSSVLSGNCRWLYAGDWGAISKWDVTAGKLIWTRQVSIRNVQALALSLDESFIAVDASSGAALILDTTTGAIVARSRPSPLHEILSIAWIQDGIAIGFDDGQVEVRSASDPDQILTRLPGCSRAVLALILSPDRKLLAGIEDTTRIPKASLPRSAESTSPAHAHLWNLSAARERRDIVPPSHSLPADCSARCAAFSPDGRVLAVADMENRVRFFSPASDEERSTPPRLMGATSEISCLAFSPDGTRIGAGCNDGSIHLWDAVTGEAVAIFRADRNVALSFAGKDHGDKLVACGADVMTVFETDVPPSSTLAEREHIRQARAYVDPLILEQFPLDRRLASVVKQQVLEKPGVSAETRRAALEFLTARGDHAATANGYAWGFVRSPDERFETYQMGLRLAEVALVGLPDSSATLNTYATALYRTLQYERAIEYSRKSIARRIEDGFDPIPADYALMACSFVELKRLSEAREHLERAHQGTRLPSFTSDEDTRSIIQEAEAKLARFTSLDPVRGTEP